MDFRFFVFYLIFALSIYFYCANQFLFIDESSYQVLNTFCQSNNLSLLIDKLSCLPHNKLNIKKNKTIIIMLDGLANDQLRILKDQVPNMPMYKHTHSYYRQTTSMFSTYSRVNFL